MAVIVPSREASDRLLDHPLKRQRQGRLQRRLRARRGHARRVELAEAPGLEPVAIRAEKAAHALEALDHRRARAPELAGLVARLEQIRRMPEDHEGRPAEGPRLLERMLEL